MVGVRKKGRRRIRVGTREFVWFVAENDDGPGLVLTVVSEDKHMILRYGLGQPPGEEYLLVLGRDFAGASTGGPWRRFQCPRWEEAGGRVTPAAVRAIIEWALDGQAERVEVRSPRLPGL